MPELPEVETVRRELLISVQNKKIEHVVLLRQKNVKAEPRAFIEGLEGATIIDVNRKGKCLRFDLDNGYSFYSHLRMEGKYFLRHQGDSYDKFDLLVIDFTDGTSLRYNDVRKFGTFHLGLTKDAEVNGPFSEIGPEPFNLSGKELKEAFSKRNIPVKVALLDQPIISGIGNIYDSEILFASKIDPMTKACDLTLAQCDTIIEEARRILNRAIEAGGTTIKSFHHGDNIDGMFQLELQAYGKEGEPCPSCGHPIKRAILGGRSSYYCPICQRQKDTKLVLGITGPIHAGKSTGAAYFKERGYLHFDADLVASSLYERKSCQKKIAALLGEGAYIDGKLNRDYIRDTLNKSKAKKQALEKYLYPLVKKEAERFIAKAPKGSKILLDVPLLFPSHIDELCTYTILIDSPLEQRIARLEKEGRPTEALVRLNQEYPLEQAKKKADYIVRNDAGVGEFLAKLESLKLS